jgi:hypothetical protein
MLLEIILPPTPALWLESLIACCTHKQKGKCKQRVPGGGKHFQDLLFRGRCFIIFPLAVFSSTFLALPEGKAEIFREVLLLGGKGKFLQLFLPFVMTEKLSNFFLCSFCAL